MCYQNISMGGWERVSMNLECSEILFRRPSWNAENFKCRFFGMVGKKILHGLFVRSALSKGIGIPNNDKLLPTLFLGGAIVPKALVCFK